MNILPLETALFSYRHLLAADDIQSQVEGFSVGRESGMGLEFYLKNVAAEDEKDGSARTYLVYDKFSLQVVSYFTLRTGLFAVQIAADYFYTVPSIELSNFAVNARYRQSHPEIDAIGSTVFSEFILPIVDFVRDYVGIQALYIYALPEPSLIAYYETLGFHRLEGDEEEFVHSHVKPKYDEGCIFMYQIL